MARVYRSFRVFISSTFADLVAERDALRRHVFPRLEEECRQRGARFQAVDLRWGVSEEAGRDHQTLAICLDELHRCRRESRRPNFLILLGDRYGWRPLPASIEADEFESLVAALPEVERERLTRWYRRDDNAVPPAYVLLTREGAFEDRDAWAREEAELRRLLLHAVGLAGWSATDPSREKYEASATHQEIHHGALRVALADRQVLCYLRTLDGLPRDGRAGVYLDLDASGRPDAHAAARLQQLEADLLRALPPQYVHEYRARWTSSGVTADHLAALCARVYDDLRRIIDEELAGLKELSAFDVEVRAHEDFALERAAHFLGREALRLRIIDHLRGSDARPLVIHGASGSGKTALVSRALLDCLESTATATPVFRFLGATPASSEVRSLLENLCGQLATLYPDNQPVPGDFAALAQDFARRLTLATAERPLLLFLDAVDQLAPTDGAHSLFWLPRPLPANVRLVLSVLETDGPAGDCFRAAQSLFPPECLVPLEPLSPEHGGRLLDSWLAEAKRTLQPGQRELILTRFAGCPRPLYLKLAFEEARRWKSFDAPASLRDDIPGVLHDLFARLARDSNHGEVLVERALAALGAARYGLTEEELLGVLSTDADVMRDFRRRSPESPASDQLPWVVWSRLYHDLEPYLTERRADGAALLSFYHRQVGEAVVGRFLNGDDAVRAHRRLAAFFAGRPTYLRRADGADVPDRRKASELAYQQVRGGMWDELEATLAADLNFLEAKCAAGQVFELAADFAAAVLRMPPDRPGRRTLRLLEEAVRTDIHFLARHPEALFQCLWNRAWWYDSPEAAAHCEAPADGWPPEGPPWSRPVLAPLLERWRAEKERRKPGFAWLRSLRPPDVHLGTPHRAVFRGHEAKVGGVAVSADGRVIVSGSDDRTVRVWDATGGQPIALLRGHEGPVNAVACSADGRVILSGSDDRTVRAWDAEAGQVRAILHGHTAEVTGVAVSPGGRLVVSGSNDTTVRLWSPSGWAEAAVLAGHRDKVTSVAVSSDGRRVASGSFDKTVIVWDTDSGKPVATLRGHDGVVTSVAFSPDGRRVVSGGTDRTVRIWEAESGRLREAISGHTDRVTSVAWTGDGRRVVSGSYDQTVRLSDPEGAQSPTALRGHEAGVHSLACSGDGRLIVSGSRDATVRVWDAHGGQSLARLHGHDDEITTVAWTADGKRVATSSDDRTVRIWYATALPGPRLAWHSHRVLHLDWSRDGSRLATASGDTFACIWSADGSGELKWLRGHEKEVCWVAFSPDGLRLATGSFDETVRVWDTDAGAELLCLRGHRDWVTNLAWSPDGRLLASGSRDGTVRLWDAVSGRQSALLQGHKSGIRGVSFSGDGRLLVTGSKDETVRVWEPTTGRLVGFLKGHRERIAAVALSADGRRAASRSRDRVTRIWDLESGVATEELDGVGDTDALAAGPERFPWRAVARGLETAVESAATGKAVAWFPLAADRIATHPAGRVWACVRGNRLTLFTLEGGEGPASLSPPASVTLPAGAARPH